MATVSGRRRPGEDQLDPPCKPWLRRDETFHGLDEEHVRARQEVNRSDDAAKGTPQAHGPLLQARFGVERAGMYDPKFVIVAGDHRLGEIGGVEAVWYRLDALCAHLRKGSPEGSCRLRRVHDDGRSAP